MCLIDFVFWLLLTFVFVIMRVCKLYLHTKLRAKCVQYLQNGEATMSTQNLKERLNNDLKEAMKSGNTFLRDTLRLLNADIKRVEVDTHEVLDDTKIISILQKASKQRKDAIEAYKKGGRDDLLDKEQKELDIITSYLPAELSDDELRQKLESIIKEIGATSPKDMGKVMGAAKGLNANGSRISQMVKTLLGQA